MNLIVLLLVTSYNLISVFCKFQYPNVRRDDSVSEDLFGTIVSEFLYLNSYVLLYTKTQIDG
jgi:hypothetical protein